MASQLPADPPRILQTGLSGACTAESPLNSTACHWSNEPHKLGRPHLFENLDPLGQVDILQGDALSDVERCDIDLNMLGGWHSQSTHSAPWGTGC